MISQESQDLVIDVGNSRMKLGLFTGGRLLAHTHADRAEMSAVAGFLGGIQPARIAIGSTAAHDDDFLRDLRSVAPLTVITGDSPSPLGSLYTTRATLGVDRLANAVGAARLHPGRPVLAIDLGTCITYDLVDGQAVYRGGIIAPGLHMRAKAMHAFSARLPLVDPPLDPPFLGTDTASSLIAGVHHGVAMELKGVIGQLGRQYPGLAVVLTGGDAPRAARALKSGIFAHPVLTLVGLHALLHHDPDIGPAVRH